MTSTCFVIQPFDGGKFDDRFRDTFKPAIERAGLEPYRVDLDPSVSVPIEEIENGIQRVVVCFAEITSDNPNVWFELGYAICARKEICMVCSEEREGRFPFDVQHRSIIKYKTSSKSDFENLERQIADRLIAIQKKETALESMSASFPLADTQGLTQHEIVLLCAIMQNKYGINGRVSFGALVNDMERLGYNRLAVNLALKRLQDKEYVEVQQDQDRDSDPYDSYDVTKDGTRWMLANEDKLALTAQPVRRPSKAKSRDFSANPDEEIPF